MEDEYKYDDDWIYDEFRETDNKIDELRGEIDDILKRLRKLEIKLNFGG